MGHLYVFHWIHNYDCIIRKTARWKASILTDLATLTFYQYNVTARGKNDTDKVREPTQIFANFKYIS